MRENDLPPHQRLAAPVAMRHDSVAGLLAGLAGDERPLVLFPAHGDARLAGPDLRGRASAVAAHLRAEGLGPGDRVAMIVPNAPDFVVLYFGCLLAGVILVPINPDLSAREAAYIVEDSGTAVLYYHETQEGKAREACRTSGRAVAAGEVPGSWARGREAPPPAPPAALPALPALDDRAVIIYTSGTTGHPKGVVLSHRNLLSDAAAIADWFSFGAATRALCVLPMFHNNGQIVTLLAPLLAGGSTVIVEPRTSLLTFWGLAERYGCTWTSVMPSILAILLGTRSRYPGATPLAGIVCGGQVLTREVQDDFETAFGVPIFEGFGLTETTSFACFNNHPARTRVPGVVGRPLPVNEMSVQDGDGRLCGPGEEGELCIRGYNVAVEYLGLPEVNASTFRGGWFHSGDYGVRDEDGYYRFLGRKDFLVIKGGENIYPAELENVLFGHDAVAEAAVVGVPDPLLGEDLVAFVRLNPGADATEQALRSWCEGRIAKFKQPREILVVDRLPDMDDIPRGPTQKVLYRKLREYHMTMTQRREKGGS